MSTTRRTTPTLRPSGPPRRSRRVLAGLLLVALAAARAEAGPLHEAAAAGDVGRIAELASAGADLREVDDRGMTPLLVAVFAEEPEACDLLLREGADPAGLSTIDAGSMIARGLELGPDERVQVTPLLAAAAVGNAAIVEVLLDAGVDAGASCEPGRTPLLTASMLGHGPAAALLIEAGADLDERGEHGINALLVAVQHQHHDIARALLAAGAAVDADDDDGRTPVLAAVGLADLELLALLADANADLDRADRRGMTPLLVAVYELADRELSAALIERGADVDRTDDYGHTPVQAAVERGSRELIDLLADAGADLDRADKRGITPLRSAIELPDTALAEFLIARGASVVDAPDEDGRPPLVAAVEVNGIRGDLVTTPAPTAPMSSSAAVLGIALDVEHGKIYWTDFEGGRIRRAALDGSGVEAPVEVAGPVGVAVDAKSGQLFWTTDASYPRALARSALDGSNVKRLVAGRSANRPAAVAVDATARKIYWSESVAGRIRRANLDGTRVEDLLTSGLGVTDRPGAEVTFVPGIAVDPVAGKLYWTELTTATIRRADLDGSGAEVLLDRSDGLDSPIGLALDLSRKKLYWTDQVARRIGRADLDGSSAEEVAGVADGLVRPRAIAIDAAARNLYWSDTATGAIRRAPLDGSAIETIVPGHRPATGPACDDRVQAAGSYLASLAIGHIEACMEKIAATKAVKTAEDDADRAALTCTAALARAGRLARSDERARRDIERIAGEGCEVSTAAIAETRARATAESRRRIAEKHPRAREWLEEVRPFVARLTGRESKALSRRARLAMAALDTLDAGLEPAKRAPTDTVTALPASGQTTAYPAHRRGNASSTPVADDGRVRAGRAMRFADGSDGTVTDLATGLMWEKKCDCDGGLHDFRASFAWAGDDGDEDETIWSWLESINEEGGGGFADHDDWRIPTVQELVTIVDYERFNPSAATEFDAAQCGLGCDDLGDSACSCTEMNSYWSSTAYADGSHAAVAVGFNLGLVGDLSRHEHLPVRAVRGTATVIP